jgi:DnaK suppressor protein
MKTAAANNDTKRQQKLRAMLVALRDETYERVRELRNEQGDDIELVPADEMDQARASVDVATHAGLIARAEERLHYIDEALGRIEQGRYGTCAQCHEPIGVERLKALPFAVYCVECQQKRNRRGRGWSEGGTIEPYNQQWDLPEEMEEQPEYTASMEEEMEVTYGAPFGSTEPETPRRRGRPAKASAPKRPVSKSRARPGKK